MVRSRPHVVKFPCTTPRPKAESVVRELMEMLLSAPKIPVLLSSSSGLWECVECGVWSCVCLPHYSTLLHE